MIQGIAVNGIALADQCRDRTNIGRVASWKQQSGFGPRQGSQLAFELRVKSTTTGY